MSKLNHKEIINILAFIQGEKIFKHISPKVENVLYSLVDDLSRDELKELNGKLVPDSQLSYVVATKYHSTCKGPKKIFLRAEVNDLLRWYREGVKGRVAGARSALKYRYDYLSDRERRNILEAFFEKDKPSDRKWVYRKLTEEWDESYRKRIENLWERYKEDDCAMLILKHFDRSFILSHRQELDNYKTHWWLQMYMAHDLSWPIERDKFSDLKYLQMVCYSGRSVDDAEVLSALFGVISGIVNESKRIEEDENIIPSFSISTYSYKEVRKAVWYIGKAGYINIVIGYAVWDSSLYNYEECFRRQLDFDFSVRSLPDSERKIRYSVMREKLYEDFYTSIFNHFPKKFRWMLNSKAAQYADGIEDNGQDEIDAMFEGLDSEKQNETNKQKKVYLVKLLKEAKENLKVMCGNNKAIGKLVKKIQLELSLDYDFFQKSEIIWFF